MNTINSSLVAPSRSPNNFNGRSRSPSPAANPTSIVHKPLTLNLQPDNNANPIRNRRNTPTDTGIKAEDSIIPLIEAETTIDPPLANPETDDSGDDRETTNKPYPGVDDGFFFDRSNPDGPTIPDPSGTVPSTTDDADGGRRVFPARGPFSPTNPNFGTDKSVFDIDLSGVPDLDSIPDVNIYQHKKTLAQGMMDLALFSANANQLRYVLENSMHPYFYPGVVLISISLLLQVAIGVGLIWNSRYNVKDEKEICIANKINNFTIIGIFLVTVVNVFISAFGVASTPVAAAAASSNNP